MAEQGEGKPPAKRKRGTLSKQQVVAAAFALVDTEGPDV